MELRRRDLEVLRLRPLDYYWLGAGQQHHVRVGHPIGRRNDDLIAWVQQGLGQIVETLFAATGHQHLFGFVIETVLALEFGDNRLLQPRGAVDGGVFGEPVLNRPDGGLFDMLGGVKVRLAGTQSNDVLAGGAHGGGTGGYRQGRRGLDGSNTVGKSLVHVRDKATGKGPGLCRKK